MASELQWDVFVSHSSRDKPRVLALAERLRDAGLRVWLDDWVIAPGMEIYAAIEDGLERSRTLLLCLSRAAFESDWALLERGTAIFRDPQNRQRRFIPVLLEDCRVPDTIRRFAHIDWRTESEEQLSKLISACRPAEPSVEPEPAAGEWRYEQLAALSGHTSFIAAIAVTSDGRRALSASDDNTLRLWDLETGRCLHVLEGHTDSVNDCAIEPGDSWAVSASDDGTLRIWDLGTGACMQTLVSPGKEVNGVAVLPSGRHLLSADFDHNIRLWELRTGRVQTGRVIRVLKGHPSVVFSVAVALGGRTAVSGSLDGVVNVWDVENGTLVAKLSSHTSWVFAVAISPDGRLALSGGRDAVVRLWNVADHRCMAVLEGHSGWVRSVALSPNGRLALSNTGGGSGGLWLWQIPTGESLLYIPQTFIGAAFSPDGTRILAGIRGSCDIAVYRLLPPVAEITSPIASVRVPYRTARYTNAKVVLLGESGVGKTGLLNRLVSDRYEKTDSTHGMTVTRAELPVAEETGIDREVWLWDLAGQDDYRLIHQLFLDETAVAVVVINPQADDPFEGIDDWLKALRTALRRAPHEPALLLVAGRVDVGGMKVSEEKIRRFVSEHGFTGYLATSAKSGEGCSDSHHGGPSPLKRLIAECIPWDELPFIATDRLLRVLKNAVQERAAQSDAAIVRFSELVQQLRAAFPNEAVGPEDVRLAVKLLGNQGVVLPLDFGDLVLLRPAELSCYAAAVIRQARNHRIRPAACRSGMCSPDGSSGPASSGWQTRPTRRCCCGP